MTILQVAKFFSNIFVTYWIFGSYFYKEYDCF